MDWPEGWKDVTVHTLEGPTAAGRAHRITVQVIADADGSAPEDFAAPFIEAAQRTLPEATLLTSETITLNEPRPGDAATRKGLQAQRVLLRWAAQGADRQHVQLQFFLLAGATGFVVSSSFSASSWKEVGVQVERVMRSIHPARARRGPVAQPPRFAQR